MKPTPAAAAINDRDRDPLPSSRETALAVVSGSVRPPLTLLASEPLRAASEYVLHKLVPLSRPVAGDGHPVVIFPGLAASTRSVAPLRDHVQSLGYKALDWGRGLNTGPRGDVDKWLEGLAKDVDALLKGHAAPASLIGWSLGGLYARELAKILAPRVRQVITIGTPFNVPAGGTHVGWLFRLLSGMPAVANSHMSARLLRPPPVPTTSIYSRSDGVVAWQACMHEGGAPHVEDIEVRGSHIGMVWNRDVLSVVSDRLALHAGQRRRFTGSDEAMCEPMHRALCRPAQRF